MAQAHTTSVQLRLAFWNTWLLAPRVWPGGPHLPWSDRVFAPDVERRAELTGEALRDRFDVIALAEAFEDSEQAAVAARLGGMRLMAGPRRTRRRFTGSGLATLVDERRLRVAGSSQLVYRSGGDLRDSDTFATKGALMVQLDVVRDTPEGATAATSATEISASIDVVSTHLFAGGDLFPIPGANNTARHHRVRLGQLRELVEFIDEHRRDDAALVLAGDFNVSAHDRDPRLGDPTERYVDMCKILEPLGVSDLWANAGVGPGHTCTFDHPSDLPPDPEDRDRVLDLDGDRSPTAGERIDYLWFAPPGSARPGSARPSAVITAERPRRWAFGGRDARGGPAGSLSDHLCLSVTLDIRPR